MTNMKLKLKKINIFDIATIILLLALCFAAYFKFNINEHTKTDAKMDLIEYKIKFPALRKYSLETFASGDTVYDSQTKLAIGTIKAIDYEPAKVICETSTGDAVVAENPEKFDITLTVETNGMETDKAYFADRSVELKVGNQKQVETLYIKSTGTVMSVRTIK
ncbi:MAG: DUF4330 domain-containing protein [Clostridia bacterium]|nr:DUF4330 domain-containing protein [Clostridia bacterium]